MAGQWKRTTQKMNMHTESNIATPTQSSWQDAGRQSVLCPVFTYASAFYIIAEELGANKIALGHHRDDFIETLLNQFYADAFARWPQIIEANGGQQ